MAKLTAGRSPNNVGLYDLPQLGGPAPRMPEIDALFGLKPGSALAHAFHGQFSSTEKNQSQLSGGMTGDPFFEARQSLTSIVHHLEADGISEFIIQSADQSRGIVLKLLLGPSLGPKQLGERKKTERDLATATPALPCRYKCCDAAALRRHRSEIQRRGGCGVGQGGKRILQINAEPAEQDILRTHLGANAAALTQRCRDRFAKSGDARSGWTMSFLTPMYKAKSTGKDAKQCAVCGKSSKLCCSRCKVVRYCGKVCQRQHWKKGGHRKICKPPLEHVDIDVATVPPSYRGQLVGNISNTNSTGQLGRAKPMRADDLA